MWSRGLLCVTHDISHGQHIICGWNVIVSASLNICTQNCSIHTWNIIAGNYNARGVYVLQTYLLLVLLVSKRLFLKMWISIPLQYPCSPHSLYRSIHFYRNIPFEKAGSGLIKEWTGPNGRLSATQFNNLLSTSFLLARQRLICYYLLFWKLTVMNSFRHNNITTLYFILVLL